MTHYQNEKNDLLDYFARMLSNPEDYDAKESLSATKKVEKNSQLSLSKEQALNKEQALSKEQAKVIALQQDKCEQKIKDEVSLAEDKATKNSVEITDNENTASTFDALGNSSQETVVTHDEQVTKNADTQILTSAQDSIDAQAQYVESKSNENQVIDESQNQSLAEHDLVVEPTVFKEKSANNLKDNDICESVAQEPLVAQSVIELEHDASKDHEDIQDNSSQEENKEPLAMIVPFISFGSQENEATHDHDTQDEKLSSKFDTNADSVQIAQISAKTSNSCENEDLVKSEQDGVDPKLHTTTSDEECSKKVQNLSLDEKSSVDKEDSEATPKEHVHVPEVAMQKQQISEEKNSTFVRTTPSLEALLEKVNSDLETEQLETEQLETEQLETEQLETEQNVALQSEVEEQCNADVKTAFADKVTTKTQDLVHTQTKIQDDQSVALTEVPVQQTILQTKLQEQKAEPKVEPKVAELTVQDTIQNTAQKTVEETASKIAEQQTAVLTEPKTQSINKIETKCETQVESATVVATDTENKVKEQVKTKTLESSETQTAPKIEIAQVTQKELQSQTKEAVKESVDTTIATATSSESSQQIPELAWSKLELPDEFQVLFFLVKGVRFAVPLIALGGIFECTRLTQIAGRPAWYKGMSDIRGTKLSVVDTMAWVKPEDHNEHDYKYLIVLDRSNWALGCDELEGNRVLQKSQLKLREKAGSRPWLAGIVKKEMCALLHVQAMTAMFDRGMALNKQV